MRVRLLAVIVMVLLAGSAHAANSKAAVSFSIVCNGAKTGPCPN